MRIEGLSFAYERSTVFSNVDVCLERPLDMIVGPSGSGKTTLLKILAGILPHQSTGMLQPQRSRLLVLQEDALIPWLTGWANLLEFLHPHGIRKAQIEAHPAFASIAAFVDQPAWQMSFGQRRSIELLRALMLQPELLCLDEPLNFIDPERRVLFARLILEHDGIQQVVIATHETSDFGALAARPLRLDGRLPVHEIHRRPA